MYNSIYKAVLCLLLGLIGSLQAIAQSSATLLDGSLSSNCSSCKAALDKLPHEVLWGIHISDEGEISFSTNSITWFHKIFNDRHMGITVDLIARSRYSCNKTPLRKDLTNGFVLEPVYLDELIRRADTTAGNINIPIGKVPPQLRTETLEGNLVIVNNRSICYYSQTIDIPRDILDLLPMGLYTDTLLQRHIQDEYTDTAATILYTVKRTITIPFSKNTTTFQPADIQRLRDSLENGNYRIRKLELRAYTSVEGNIATNRLLMQQRTSTALNAIAAIAPGKYHTTILPAENWIEFNQHVIPRMPQWACLSRQRIKEQLEDKTLRNNLETILASHRKVVITVWLDRNTGVTGIANEALLPAWNKSLKAHNLQTSRNIQKEVALRILDGKLPVDYIGKLEVPDAVSYKELLSDQVLYRYYLQQALEDETLNSLYPLRHKYPQNTFLNYNICALELQALRNNPEAAINTDQLKTNIQQLLRQGIHPALVSRMLINYHIVLCGKHMLNEDYEAKDKAVEYIREAFKMLPIKDHERYTLAQFFTAYHCTDLAMDIIRPRVDQLDAGEDVVFYFINLCFFNAAYQNKHFVNAMLNAVNLNRPRFCRFFDPIDKDGASFQLLEIPLLRKHYCDNCPQ